MIIRYLDPWGFLAKQGLGLGFLGYCFGEYRRITWTLRV